MGYWWKCYSVCHVIDTNQTIQWYSLWMKKTNWHRCFLVKEDEIQNRKMSVNWFIFETLLAILIDNTHIVFNYKSTSFTEFVVFVQLCVCVCVCIYIYIYIYTHTGCPRRNVPDFGRVFLMLKYTDITQDTYIQSWTVTEIMVRKKCGLLARPHTVIPLSGHFYPSWQSLFLRVASN